MNNICLCSFHAAGSSPVWSCVSHRAAEEHLSPRLSAKIGWHHIGPYLVNVVETLLLRSAFAHISPAWRVLAVGIPERILLLANQHNLVYPVVLTAVRTHDAPSVND